MFILTRRGGKGGTGMALGRKGLQLDVDRLFASAERHHTSAGIWAAVSTGEAIVPTALPFNLNAILTACLRLALKAAVEVVRLCRFSRAGYQQV